MVKINWLISAKEDLREIFEYISLDSKSYANLQVVRIKSSTQILKLQPRIGKIVIELKQPEIREIIEGNYRIIYKIINEGSIDILLIHRGARDLVRRFESNID